MIFSYFIINNVYKYEWIVFFSKVVSPFVNFILYLFAYFRHKVGRNINIIQICYLLLNIMCKHAPSIKRKNFIFQTICIMLIFFDNFRFEFSIAVMRNRNFYPLSCISIFRLVDRLAHSK